MKGFLLPLLVLFAVLRLFFVAVIDAPAALGCPLASEIANGCGVSSSSACTPLCNFREVILEQLHGSNFSTSLNKYFEVDLLTKHNDQLLPVQWFFIWLSFIYTPSIILLCARSLKACTSNNKGDPERNRKVWKRGVVVNALHILFLGLFAAGEVYGPFPTPDLGKFLLYNVIDYTLPFAVLLYCWLSLRAAAPASSASFSIKRRRKVD
ncbi:hypothetical protein QOT17_008965 [Balamuthia mandrillaris]